MVLTEFKTKPFEVRLMQARLRGDPYSVHSISDSPVTDVVALDSPRLAAIANRIPMLFDLATEELTRGDEAWADEARLTSEGPCWFGLHAGRLWVSREPTSSARQLCVLKGQATELVQASISSDLHWIATVDIHGLVQVWRKTNGTPLWHYEQDRQHQAAGAVEQVRFGRSTSSPRLVIVEAETISVIAVDGSTRPIQIDRSKSRTFDLVDNPPGLAISDGKQVWLEPNTRSTHLARTQVIRSTADGNTLMIGAGSGAIRIWDRWVGLPILDLTRTDQPIRSIDLSPSETILVVGDEAGNVHVWNTNVGRPVAD
jgi:WD40 repeat protein